MNYDNRCSFSAVIRNCSNGVFDCGKYQNCFLNLTFFNIYYVYGERRGCKGLCIGMYIGDFYTFYMNHYVVEIQHKFNLISFIDLNYLQK